MPELVANCPRCGASKITFDLLHFRFLTEEYNWQTWYEAYSVCRLCRGSVIFVISQREIKDSDHIRKTGLQHLQGAINNYFRVERFLSIKDHATHKPPDHVPSNIKSAFEEGAACMAVACFNAGATMFRLCIDHATKSLLPPSGTQGPNAQIRRSLGLRLNWLFDNNLLPSALKQLSACIKEDGNDGAHEGTLSKEDAEDLLDFTTVLLERLYTEPERLRQAGQRRTARRNQASQAPATAGTVPSP